MKPENVRPEKFEVHTISLATIIDCLLPIASEGEVICGGTVKLSKS